MADNASIVFVNHTADRLPGDYASLPVDEARRLVEAAAARYATEDEVAAAVAAAQQAERDATEALDRADQKLADVKKK